MSTVLCTDCFPDWENHEILTIGVPMKPCVECGRHDDRISNNGANCHAFGNDPRDKEGVRKVKVSELTGAKLDYWVAKIDRGDVESIRLGFEFWKREVWDEGVCRYSIDWRTGGPIIERDRIAIEPGASDTGNWLAEMVHPARTDGVQRTFTTGPTPLIAAMRAKVSSVYGDEVPDVEKQQSA